MFASNSAPHEKLIKVVSCSWCYIHIYKYIHIYVCVYSVSYVFCVIYFILN